MDATNCLICRGAASFYCSKGRAAYFKCGACGTIFQQPLPTLKEMKDYVDAQYLGGLYKEYLEADELKYAGFERRLADVMGIFSGRNPSAGPPRMLDAGCSNGRFVEVAVRHGLDARGLELSENAIAAAPPGIGKRIYHGDANQLETLGIGKFDIVTVFDLLEHLFDPARFLKNLRKITAADGIIVITTPDAGSFLRLMMGGAWPMLQPFQHTILLSRKAAGMLLREAGFGVISCGGAKKVFTPDYLFGQLRELNPRLHGAYEKIKKILPKSAREHKIRANLGEMMIAAAPDKGLGGK